MTKNNDWEEDYKFLLKRSDVFVELQKEHNCIMVIDYLSGTSADVSLMHEKKYINTGGTEQ